jgi:type IV pilus assembly protein PilC
MTTYSYSAVNGRGQGARGTLQAADQTEALRRIKEMGFYPTTVTDLGAPLNPAARARRHAARLFLKSQAVNGPAAKARIRVKPRQLATFTRQLATLLEAGMPLLRSLRLLDEQEADRRFKRVITGLGAAIEGGSSLSEALSEFPGVFDKLYVNLVKAGEISGVMEASLKRLADFMEKTGRIKGKVKAAMFYPAAVITVAAGVMALMLLVIVPKFKAVFGELAGGRPLPGFTRFVLGLSETVKNNFIIVAVVGAALYGAFLLAKRTRTGRRLFDRFKLKMPVLGPVFRKLAVARFTRTLGTLVTSGVPILPALKIVQESTGNVIVGALAGRVHDNVEQGESITGPLRGSGIFPAMVVGLVDVGEQTGALPEMLNKIADNYDEEVDNSVASMTSLLEPVMIVVLGVVVGSIVVALFLPIIDITNHVDAVM